MSGDQSITTAVIDAPLPPVQLAEVPRWAASQAGGATVDRQRRSAPAALHATPGLTVPTTFVHRLAPSSSLALMVANASIFLYDLASLLRGIR